MTTARENVQSPVADAGERPTQLHVVHNWGGGTQRWLEDFCRADAARRNLVLQATVDAAGRAERLVLLARPDDRRPIAAWTLRPAVQGTSLSHPGYQEVLAEIIAAYDVRAILVSSLIGQSLDVLRTELPTALVLHDHYPFCPAIFAVYGTDAAPDVSCPRCDASQSAACLRSNRHHRFFPFAEAGEWERLRTEFVACVERPHVVPIVPSPFLVARWPELEPRLAAKPIRCIPHGLDLPALGIVPASASSPRAVASNAVEAAVSAGRRPRIVVPGVLSSIKGRGLFEQAVGRLTAHYDVVLLGCGPEGNDFASIPGVRVIPSYRREELLQRLREIAPAFGLLLSVVAETYGYTLDELKAAGIPPVATQLGGYADRIRHGEDGFLFEPDAAALLRLVEQLRAEPQRLDAVRARLADYRPRSVAAMTAEYHAVLTPAPVAMPPAARATAPSGGAIREAEPMLVASNRTVESLFEELYATISARVDSSPRLRPWQRPLVRWAVGGGYRLAKLACRLTGPRRVPRSHV